VRTLAHFPELGGFVATPVYDRYGCRPGDELTGPAIVEERESTVSLRPVPALPLTWDST